MKKRSTNSPRNFYFSYSIYNLSLHHDELDFKMVVSEILAKGWIRNFETIIVDYFSLTSIY